jgi:hypothetical protein
MSEKKSNDVNKTYIIAVATLTFILPVVCSLIEIQVNKSEPFSVALFGKWFIFSAVGLRLFAAGIKQTTNPSFTAKEIFHINVAEVLPVVRELGFANLCFGLIGILSLFFPAWRIVSAFGSGLYYGIAGVQHLFKKPAGTNEAFALVTDIIIFLFLLFYFIKMM